VTILPEETFERWPAPLRKAFGAEPEGYDRWPVHVQALYDIAAGRRLPDAAMNELERLADDFTVAPIDRAYAMSALAALPLRPIPFLWN
jgi:hypothetical protein